MADNTSVRVLGIAGSLRKALYNRALLNAAVEIAPETMPIEIFEGLDEVPLYNENLLQRGIPAPVQHLKDRIRANDALLIATPEYNYSIPGVLKNAIDWVSRPPTDNTFKGKPVAIMGASTGNFGTARAQMALRQVFVFVEGYVMLRPELLVFKAKDRFDADNNLTDEETRKCMGEFLKALSAWTIRLRGAEMPQQKEA